MGAVDGIDRKYSAESELKVMAQSESGIANSDGVYTMTGDSYLLFNRLQVHNKISFTVKTASASDKFGFSLVRGTDSKEYYSIIVNPESDTTRKINFEEEGEEGIGFVEGIDGYLFNTPSDNVYDITVYTDNSVCVVYINDNVAYTNRIYGIQKNCWSINNYGGEIEISDIKAYSY